MFLLNRWSPTGTSTRTTATTPESFPFSRIITRITSMASSGRGSSEIKINILYNYVFFIIIEVIHTKRRRVRM